MALSLAQGRVCCPFCRNLRDQSYHKCTGEGRSLQNSEGTPKMKTGLAIPAGPWWGLGAEVLPPSQPGRSSAPW